MARSVRPACLPLLCVLLLAGCQATPEQPGTTGAAPPAQSEAPVAPPQDTTTAPPEPEPEPVAVTPQPPSPVEVQEPEATAPVVCQPPPTPPPAPVAPARPATVLPVLGAEEYVTVDPPGVRLKARLDTGTSSSLLDARNVREFERDGKAWVKFLVPGADDAPPVEVSRPVLRSSPSRASGRRYVVTLRTHLGSIDQFTEFTLSDRTGQSHAVVLGRNFLRDQALVDVARRFTIPVAKN